MRFKFNGDVYQVHPSAIMIMQIIIMQIILSFVVMYMLYIP
jgi:hypothetical protein